MASLLEVVYLAALRAPQLDETLAQTLFDRASASRHAAVLGALIGRADLPEALEQRLRAGGNANVLIAWVRRPERTVEQITELLEGEKRVTVRAALAALTGLPDATYETLASDTTLTVAAALAANESTSVAVKRTAITRIASHWTDANRPQRSVAQSAAMLDDTLTAAFLVACPALDACTSVLIRREQVDTATLSVVTGRVLEAIQRSFMGRWMTSPWHPAEVLLRQAHLSVDDVERIGRAAQDIAAQGQAQLDSGAALGPVLKNVGPEVIQLASRLHQRCEQVCGLASDVENVTGSDELARHAQRVVSTRLSGVADKVLAHPDLTVEIAIAMSSVAGSHALLEACERLRDTRLYATAIAERPALGPAVLRNSDRPSKILADVLRLQRGSLSAATLLMRLDPAARPSAIEIINAEVVAALPVGALRDRESQFIPAALRARIGALIGERLAALDATGLAAFETLCGTAKDETPLGALLDGAAAVAA